MRNMQRIGESASLGIIASVVASRSDLLRRVERWTYCRKIKLCAGLSAKVIVASEVILAHGLTQEEIDRWMEVYKRGDFEALKVGYGKKRRAVSDRPPPSKENLRLANSECTGVGSTCEQPDRGAHAYMGVNSDFSFRWSCRWHHQCSGV
jgi:Protein of unknown function (DUF1153)